MKLLHAKILIVGLLLVGGIIWLLAQSQHNTDAMRPDTRVLAVPFTTQAPDGNWEGNENCEEASLLMAREFLRGSTTETIVSGLATQDITAFIAWEQNRFGYYKDTGAEDTAIMAKEAADVQVRLIENFTEQDLRQAIDDGYPILLPIDATVLNNPTYEQVNVLYHMIVVRGYTKEGFIVNDPGTSKGNGNKYTFTTLKDAAADWDHAAQKLNSNRKVALVLS